MPTKKFEIGNTAAKGKIGKVHKLTYEIKELMKEFNVKNFPKLMQRADELTAKELAQVIVAFSNYIEPPRKHLSVEHTKQLEVPEEIKLLSVEQAEAMMRIFNGEQPVFSVVPQITNGEHN
jgi:hypothetical protein